MINLKTKKFKKDFSKDSIFFYYKLYLFYKANRVIYKIDENEIKNDKYLFYNIIKRYKL